MARKRTIFWFALTVFKDVPGLIQDFTDMNWETYRPVQVIEGKSVPIIPRLLFVKCKAMDLVKYKMANNQRFMYYRTPGSNKPGPVNDMELECFRKVVALMGEDVTVLGQDRPEYHLGDKVRIVAGLYSGTEGHIVRIRRDRKFLVCVEGVAVLAIANVPPEYIEKVQI